MLQSLLMSPLVVDPAIKLDWYRQNLPERIEWVKQLFIENVSIERNIGSLDLD
jgi:hypothetical protein